MYHGKTSSNWVDCVQKRALRILHNDFSLPFEVFLTRTDERKVHIKNFQKLINYNALNIKVSIRIKPIIHVEIL